jgi:hypothetical protein
VLDLEPCTEMQWVVVSASIFGASSGLLQSLRQDCLLAKKRRSLGQVCVEVSEELAVLLVEVVGVAPVVRLVEVGLAR